MRIKKYCAIIVVIFTFCAQLLLAQEPAGKHRSHEAADPVQKFLKHQVTSLTEKYMEGRGYVSKGKERAATHIIREFKKDGLIPGVSDSSYTQEYNFPVNTFPGEMSLKVNKKTLAPGADYIIDAASSSFATEKMKVKKVDLIDITTDSVWKASKSLWDTLNKIYYLVHADSLAKHLGLRMEALAMQLPKGCYIIPIHGKLTWTVETDNMPATVFYTEDTVLPRHIKRATVDVKAILEPAAKNKNENVVGIVPGEIKDSFVVFTAHYDHLGMMGNQTYFPGASDNATGTAMLLYLASYFAAHPQHYSMAFIAFSGEEAGLLGSRYFVQHPTIPLDHIRFLTNLDIMGDATEGVTVVNATEYPKEFSTLQKINDEKKWIPAVKSRGKAAISDHYFFSEAGVPSFFIFSNGGKGYYHDIFDDAAAVTFNNIPRLAHLLIDFNAELQK